MPRLAALLLLLSLCGLAADRPNVVLLYVDDLGWKDLGCQGSTVFETPHTDRLAAEGMRFTQAYSSCPVCSPSRAALMTGKTPARVGFTGHITAIGKHRYPPEGRIIPPDDHLDLPLAEVTIAEALKPVGYATASMGKWHLGGPDYWPEKQGFDLNVAGHTHGSPAGYFFPYENPKQPWNPDMPNLSGGREGEYLTDRLTDEAIDFIRDNRDGPFFLYLPHYAVHTPLQAPLELVKKYERKLTGSDKGVDPIYAAMVERTDTSLGRIMSELDSLRIAEDTVVILTSDNGGLASVTDNSPLRAGKGFLYEAGIRVPLIVHWPGVTSPGSESDVPVVGHDLYATIAEIAGDGSASGPAQDSRSLAPLLRSEVTDLAGDLYWYYPHYSPQAKQPGAAIRSGDWKLIEHYDPSAVELYNLADDPGEINDLSPVLPRERQRLLGRLHELLAEAGTKMHRLNPNHSP